MIPLMIYPSKKYSFHLCQNSVTQMPWKKVASDSSKNHPSCKIYETFKYLLLLNIHTAVSTFPGNEILKMWKEALRRQTIYGMTAVMDVEQISEMKTGTNNAASFPKYFHFVCTLSCSTNRH